MTAPETRASIIHYDHRFHDQVIALWHKCGLSRQWNDPAKDISRKLTDTTGAFFLAVDGEQVLGTVMAGYDGHRGTIYYLGVDPDIHSQGLGRRLMEHSEAYLIELGCPKINLLIRSDNEAVQAFYKKLGYAGDPTVQMGKRLIPDN